MSQHYDLIVLGGGRASGLAYAAASAGQKSALIEADKLGGTCPNRGCVPSKLLIGYSETATRIREAKRHFIDAKIENIDLEKIFQETQDWIAGVDPRYESRAPEGCTLYRGHGRFSGEKEITVTAEDGSTQTLTADTIVIATGTRPRPPEHPELPVWTSDNVFTHKGKVPRSLLIIGGGFIGTELGSFFAGVGVDTQLFVRRDALLPIEDQDIQDIFTQEFSERVPVNFHHSLKDLSHDGNTFTATFTTPDGDKTHQAEGVLFATGRIPNADDIGLEHTSIERDKRGFIQTDDNLQTTAPGVYAAGDIAGNYILQHTASYDIHYLRRKLLKQETGPIQYGEVPHAVFTDPEVAAVGQTESQLKESGQPYISVTEDWLASARAMSTRLTYPRTKLLVDPRDYRILGCHLIGPEASTMMHQVLAVMKIENDVRHLSEMIYIHPALPEALLGASVLAVKKVRAWQQQNS